VNQWRSSFPGNRINVAKVLEYDSGSRQPASIRWYLSLMFGGISIVLFFVFIISLFAETISDHRERLHHISGSASYGNSDAALVLVCLASLILAFLSGLTGFLSGRAARNRIARRLSLMGLLLSIVFGVFIVSALIAHVHLH
jgi:hypothetical protein